MYHGHSYLTLVRVFWSGIGVGMWKRAVPAYLTAGIVASFVFFGSGMDPGELVRNGMATPLLKLGMTLAWLALTSAAVRQLNAGTALVYLKSLPIPTWRLASVAVMALMSVNLLWIALWSLGGLLAVVPTTVLSVAVQILLVRSLKPASILMMIFLLGVMVLGCPVIDFLAGAAVGTYGIRSILRDLGNDHPSGAETPKSLSMFIALVSQQWLTLWRGERILVFRAVLVTCAAGVVAWLTVENNHHTDASQINRVILGIGLVAAAIVSYSVSACLARIDARASWWYRSMSVDIVFRQDSAEVLVVLAALILGLMYGLGASLFTPLGFSAVSRCAMLNSVWFAGIGGTLSGALLIRKPRGHVGTVSTVSGSLVAGGAALVWLGEAAVLLVVCTAGAAALCRHLKTKSGVKSVSIGD